MKVSVFYPTKGYTGFDYRFNGKLTKRNYDENGEFIDFEYVEPSVAMYEKVSEMDIQSQSNDEIFYKVVSSHNIGSYPSQISDKIESGELNVQHSSFSVGDIIRIEGCYYISDGRNFHLLPLEFSNDA